MPSHPDHLRAIKRLDQLVAHLRDELGWPIGSDSIEDLSYDWSPDELGLDTEHATKIKEIKQLRPLAGGQPWGIFWVNFEKKRLPVVVLRRILANLVIKSRAGAKAADKPRWQLRDLLFISAYGNEDTDQREIAFAHFHQGAGDLPTLQVLGWDGADTPLKLEHVAHLLDAKLRWPANPKDVDAWRAQWAGAFRHRLGHVIRTADLLAETLAALARGIRDRCTVLMRAESDRGPLTKLFQAFQAALIHDLTPETFADTYAQTITYGLFTAAVNRTDMSGGTEATYVKADDMTLMARSTSPFLKEMLETFLHVGGRKNGVDFDELGIQDVVELLRGDETDLPAILRDFGNRTRGEDPVIHFYEHFLSAYNKKLKIQRGVFYTPQPVVSYIVRSVHELLQTEFGLEDGLASTVTWGEMIQRFGGTSSTSPKSKEGNGRDGNGENGDSRSSSLRELSLPPLSDEPGDTRTISADEPFVQILDPATGTATFLVETVDVIFKTLKAKWDKGGLAAMPALLATGDAGEKRQGTAALHDASRHSMASGQRASVLDCASPLALSFADYWNEYVPRHLLPRLHGYELLAAPYAIAHLKLGLKLTETGYRFGSAERARIYLTNALEPKVRQLPQIGFEPLAHEAQAVNEIKWYKRFTVVIGNPPYSNFGQLNKIPFILNLLEDYKRGLDEKKINLDDDYIKFIRFSQFLLDGTGFGIFGMITNNSFLDGVTHRRMRPALMKSFQKIFLLDLHGSTVIGERPPDGGEDENVFDIQQGVSITLQVAATGQTKSEARHFDCYGDRPAKYKFLSMNAAHSLGWESLTPSEPNFFFKPKDSTFAAEYQQCCSISQMFRNFSSSIKTERDRVSIHWTKDECRGAVEDFRTKGESFLRQKYELENDSRDWKVANAKADVQSNRSENCFQRILYRPFDVRHIWYSGQTRGFIGTPGYPTMRHMLGCKNLSLIATRLNRQVDTGYFFVTRELSDIHALDNARDSIQIFPLFTIAEEGHLNLADASEANFTPQFFKAISGALKLPQKSAHGLPDGVTPEDIFHYAYAVFHSPGYRSRYAEFLKIDFPRLPLTGNLELFRALARLGGELVALHLLEAPLLHAVAADVRRLKSNSTKESQSLVTSAATIPRVEFIASPPSPSSPTVEKVSWSNNTVWLDKAQTTGFQGVREAVWHFHIGGYQVCEKWLKDRKGRTLSAADREHYQKLVVALSETIRLMTEIDAVIEKHGGWPSAFHP